MSSTNHAWNEHSMLIPINDDDVSNEPILNNNDDYSAHILHDDFLTIENFRCYSFKNVVSNSNKIDFDSDSVQSHVDSFATEGLTGFKSDFIPNFYEEFKRTTSSEKTIGSTSIIGSGTAKHSMLDDNREMFDA